MYIRLKDGERLGIDALRGYTWFVTGRQRDGAAVYVVPVKSEGDAALVHRYLIVRGDVQIGSIAESPIRPPESLSRVYMIAPEFLKEAREMLTAPEE